MANEFFNVNVRGIEDLKAELRAFPPKLRKRALMTALKAAGRVFRDEARRLTPLLDTNTKAGKRAVAKGIRTPGLVRQKLSVRPSKIIRRQGDLGVFVNVRPAQGAKVRKVGGKRIGVRVSERGANNPRDPFYWRWIEFGKKGFAGVGMLQTAAKKASSAIAAFERTLGPLVQRLNRKGAQP